MSLTIKRLNEVLAPYEGRIGHGAHANPSKDDPPCVMEAINLALGRPLGDDCPPCMAPDLHRLLVRLNDSGRWRSNASRGEVLLPAALRALGTAGDVKAMRKRAFAAADFAIRVCAADAMDARGLPEQAKRLRDLAIVIDVASAREAVEVTRDVRAAADAADAAAYASAAAAVDAAADAADAAAYASADAYSVRNRIWLGYAKGLLVAVGLAGPEASNA